MKKISVFIKFKDFLFVWWSDGRWSSGGGQWLGNFHRGAAGVAAASGENAMWCITHCWTG